MTDFISRYHAENAAITEDLLDPARDEDGRDPYAWLVDGLALAHGTAGVVLDLACGSAPVADRLPAGLQYVGVDRSEAELEQARARRPRAEVHLRDADAAVTVAGPRVVGVSVAMALMLLDLDAVLAPLGAVTAPGTRLSAVVPTRNPEPGAEDFAALLADLGSLAVPFREPLDAGTVGDRLAALGWRLVSLEEKRFARPLASEHDVALVARSFYTRGSDAGRRAVGDRLRQLRETTGCLLYPLRRLVAERSDAPTGRPR